MKEWMNEYMNERTNEWMNTWIHEWMNEWIHEWMNEYMNTWMNEWRSEYMNECMKEWMNEWMMTNYYFAVCIGYKEQALLRLFQVLWIWGPKGALGSSTFGRSPHYKSGRSPYQLGPLPQIQEEPQRSCTLPYLTLPYLTLSNSRDLTKVEDTLSFFLFWLCGTFHICNLGLSNFK
jgi:hypothetical protein